MNNAPSAAPPLTGRGLNLYRRAAALSNVNPETLTTARRSMRTQANSSM